MSFLDLSRLRELGDPARQDQLASGALLAHGLLCDCGERIRDEGVSVVGVFKGVLPTEEGPQDIAKAVVAHFHSTACPLYLDALANGIAWEGSEAAGLIRPKVEAVREMPKVRWLTGSEREAAADSLQT